MPWGVIKASRSAKFLATYPWRRNPHTYDSALDRLPASSAHSSLAHVSDSLTGNPLSIIGYCNLMLERNLGSITLTTTTKPTAAASPSHAVAPPTATATAEDNLDEVVPATEVEGVQERLAEDGAAGGESAERATADGPKRPHCSTVFRWAE